MRRLVVLLLVVTALLLQHARTLAQWVQDGAPVSTPLSSGYVNGIVPDGAGGAFVVFADSRNNADYDIFVQRIDRFGASLWALNGVTVCAAPGPQEAPDMAADGAGGVVITWEDSRSGEEDVYVQRINAAGVPQWTTNGVALCTAADLQFLQRVAPDGTGGAIVTWTDLRGGNFDIYARRVNASGVPQWAADGVAVCALANAQLQPLIVSDGAGGAIIAWEDIRDGITYHIYAQRLDAGGVAQWSGNGELVSGLTDDQYSPALVSDGAGGALLAWQDERLTGTVPDIFAGRIAADGDLVWGDGVAVCIATDGQQFPSIAADGGGGAVVVWEDLRDGTQLDIYAQRLNASGAPVWTYDGLAVCTTSGHQQFARVVSDGAGGVVVSWEDHRDGSNRDVYARALGPSGTSAWQFDGMPVTSAPLSQTLPLLAADGDGGVIVAFNDIRSGVTHIYAQRLELRYGYWGRPEPTIMTANDNPGDQGGQVVLRWAASQRDRFDSPAISHYSVWRSTDVVAATAATAPASAALRVADPFAIGPDFAGAAIWEEPTPEGPAYWEWIANQSATYQDSYSILAATRQDEVTGVPAPHYFKVVAHETDYPQTRAWESGVATTSSIDDLAPPAPLQLTGERGASGGAVFLSWKGEPAADLKHYLVYRSGSGEVTPTPPFLIAPSEAPSYVDPYPPVGTLHYVVTALDVHGNQSPPSNVVGVFDVTGVGGDTPPVTALTVLQNRPNPFTGSTELRVGLPADGDISVEIYDVAGRRVQTIEVRGAAAGWRSVPFDGRDGNAGALPSGVYFYRVSAGGVTVTNKMVIAR